MCARFGCIAERTSCRVTLVGSELWPTGQTVPDAALVPSPKRPRRVEAPRRSWLVAQHADRQLDVQRRALQLVQPTVAAGWASPREPAFLRDRTLVNEGRKQVYGTQIAGVRDGSPVPWSCEEPERMDEPRAEVGIEPFGTYVAKFAMA
nr:DUF6624 domain-containing protein [Streptomyces broussonetiae]